jgi:hypothetical protein
VGSPTFVYVLGSIDDRARVIGKMRTAHIGRFRVQRDVYSHKQTGRIERHSI